MIYVGVLFCDFYYKFKLYSILFCNGYGRLFLVHLLACYVIEIDFVFLFFMWFILWFFVRIFLCELFLILVFFWCRSDIYFDEIKYFFSCCFFFARFYFVFRFIYCIFLFMMCGFLYLKFCYFVFINWLNLWFCVLILTLLCRFLSIFLFYKMVFSDLCIGF